MKYKKTIFMITLIILTLALFFFGYMYLYSFGNVKIYYNVSFQECRNITNNNICLESDYIYNINQYNFNENIGVCYTYGCLK